MPPITPVFVRVPYKIDWENKDHSRPECLTHRFVSVYRKFGLDENIVFKYWEKLSILMVYFEVLKLLGSKELRSIFLKYTFRHPTISLFRKVSGKKPFMS